MATHATLSPSSSHRWLKCAGSIVLGRGGSSPANRYSAKGSLAHQIGENCLKNGKNADFYAGQNGWYLNGACGIGGNRIPEKEGKSYNFPVDSAMVDGVQLYLDEVRRVRGIIGKGGIFKVEERLDLDWLIQDSGGTGDHIAVEQLGCLYVHDYKNGFGVVEIGTVEEPNPQFAIYGLGALGEDNPHMVDEIELVCVQPNGIHPDGPIRRLRMPVEALQRWGETVLAPGAAKVHAATVSHKQTDSREWAALYLDPGDWCKYCAANAPGCCPKIAERIQASVNIMFGDDLLPAGPIRIQEAKDPKALTGDQLNKAMLFVDVFENWIGQTRAEAYRRAEVNAKNAAPDFKLVLGKKSSRAWGGSADDVYMRLRTTIAKDDMYAPAKLKTPAQMIKAIKIGTELSHSEITTLIAPLLAKRKPGKSSLVHVSDKRPARRPPAEDMFGDDIDILAI